MMKRVDPTIKITAAAYFLDFAWIRNLLTEAASVIDWISIHCYWADGNAPYETCVARSDSPERILSMMEHYLGATGYLGAIKVAFDEWGLRLWHHPKFHDTPPVPVDHGELAANDDNSVYTMADAVFTARFLMSCLRHPDLVQMANYAPTVNTRGLIWTHPEGLVLRSTYHVFDLFVNHSWETVLDAHVSTPTFPVRQPGISDVSVDHLDTVVTIDEEKSELSIIATNLHPDQYLETTIHLLNLEVAPGAVVRTLTGNSPDAYNDLGSPQAVSIRTEDKVVQPDEITLSLGPHSVTAVALKLDPGAGR
jgi:alpha-N-arabinofuranosidase